MKLGTFAAPILRAYCAPRAAAFSRALDDVPGAQERTLRRIIEAAAATEYARSFGLGREHDATAFRDRVPVGDYTALAPWIERQRHGRVAAITPGRVRCYEPTSGTSGAAKHIPYNDALLRSFRALFAIWTHDLLTHVLRPRSGRMFMSISPRVGTAGGFEDERAYLGAPLRTLLGPFLVGPRMTSEALDARGFRSALARTLVSCSDLEIVSIWSPSYLLLVMEQIETDREALSPLLAPQRRALLARDPIPWTELWPHLQLVSCWTAAAAAIPGSIVRARLPQTHIQGKGLLATEAPITVPLTEARGYLPLVDEIFLELEDEQGRLHLLHEAKTDRVYSIIVTQAGGLLRYRLGDRVRVTGWYRGAPLLEFVGRVDAVADLVGEKLHEDFVAGALRIVGGRPVHDASESPQDASTERSQHVSARESLRVAAEASQSVSAAAPFRMLLPIANGAARGRYQPRYCLLTDETDSAIGPALDARLSHSPRYREARALGQLGALEVVTRPDMRRTVHDHFVQRGIAAGDVKERALIPSIDIAADLHAHVLGDRPDPNDIEQSQRAHAIAESDQRAAQ